jgi:ubiquinone/menaquinone biosynthesis C-methylase UbiE
VVKVYQANEVSFATWSYRFSRLHLDLGTGDGTFVVRMARKNASLGVVGIDTCLDHLRGSARNYPDNARFVQSDARALPSEFESRFASLSINFPYGNLLESIRDANPELLKEIHRVSQPGSTLEIVINESALIGLGLDLEAGRTALERFGNRLPGFRGSVSDMSAADLRAFPSAWSRKLGYGRHPRAVRFLARRRETTYTVDQVSRSRPQPMNPLR